MNTLLIAGFAFGCLLDLIFITLIVIKWLRWKATREAVARRLAE